MATESYHLALYPSSHICGHCEDGGCPVTPDNGLSVLYRVEENLDIEVFLHARCVESWCREFDVPVPAIASGVFETIRVARDSGRN